jgi:hypothetical protein
VALDGGAADGGCFRRAAAGALSVSLCSALSLYVRRHGRARCRSTEQSDWPPKTLIIDRHRSAEAAAPRRLPRVRTVSACPGRSRYLREQFRARCRSSEHIGRPPLITTVTFGLAAEDGAPPLASTRQARAPTTRTRLILLFSRISW